MRVLIVEDQDTLAMLLERYLKPIATKTAIAMDISSAHACLRSGDYDLLTLDLNLPDSNVDGTLQNIRELKSYNPDMLVIVITGMLNMMQAEHALRAGADGFMSKQHVSLYAEDFLTTLQEVILAVISRRRKFQQSVSLLENVVEKITAHIESKTKDKPQ